MAAPIPRLAAVMSATGESGMETERVKSGVRPFLTQAPYPMACAMASAARRPHSS